MSSEVKPSEEFDEANGFISNDMLEGLTPKSEKPVVDSDAENGEEKAEKMRVRNFLPGRDFGKVQESQTNLKGREAQFIPAQLAKSHIRKMESDMRSMHQKHVKILNDIDGKYRTIEKETQDYYVVFLDKWRGMAKEKVIQYKRALGGVQVEKNDLKKFTDHVIDDLEQKNRDLTTEKNNWIKKYNDDMEAAEKKHTDEVDGMKTSYDTEIDRITGIKKEMSEQLESLTGEHTALVAAHANASSSTKSIMDYYTQDCADYALAQLLRETEHEHEVTELREELETLRGEIAAYLSAQNGLKKQLSSLEVTNKELADNVSDTVSRDKAKLAELREKKAKLREEINEWVAGFKDKVGRAPEDADKDIVRDKYLDYNTLKKSVQELEERLIRAGERIEKDTDTINHEEEDDEDMEVPVVTNREETVKRATTKVMRRLDTMAAGVKTNLDVSGEDGRDELIEKLKNELTVAEEEKILLRQKIEAIRNNEYEGGLDPEGIAGQAEEIEQLKLEREELRNEVAAAKLAAANANEDDLQELQDDLARAEAERDEWKHKASEDIAAQEEDFQKQLSEKDGEIKELQDEMAKMREDMSKPSDNDSDEVKKLKEELEKTNLDLKKAQEDAQKKKAAPAASGAKATMLATQVKEGEKEIAKLKKKIADQDTKLKNAQKAKTEAEIKAQNAQKEVSEAKEKATKDARGKVDNTKVKQMEKQIADEKKKAKLLESKLDKHEKHALSLEQDLKTQQQKMKESEAGHKKELADLEKKTGGNTKKQEQALAIAQRDLKKANEENEVLRGDVKQFKEKEKKYAEMDKDLKELKKTAAEAAEIAVQVAALTKETKTLKKENVDLEQRYRNEMIQRKKLHNIIEDMKGKIRVYCRVRPMLQYEIENGSKPTLAVPDDMTLELEGKHGTKTFTYDSVFTSKHSQEEVFEDTKRLIQSAVDGYNVCIFAYGQTGSGKTYTIQGDKENPGVAPRAIQEIFTILEEVGNLEAKISCYMIELYLDTLIDLLLPKEYRKNPPQLDIKEDSKGMIYINNVSIHEANSAEELMKLFRYGQSTRKTASTKMNDSSSRSHLVFSIILDMTNKNTKQRTLGKLSLVDLAGSERVGKTGATDERLKEGRAINKSLTALGDVISVLSEPVKSGKERFVPYRNHKLTMLMKDSIGGTAKTLMFVNISPADFNQEETQTALVYASRVKNITNEASKNVESKELTKLKADMRTLINERDIMKSHLVKNNISVEGLDLVQEETKEEDDDDAKYDDGPTN
eukprot:CAMPEP_0115011372 /NCGR_PEP_ID=MMETSP0216-20121206/23944_1 /TAXON_ID=223996 /ORGANISM="Protocruzia adherens, Strain Boccale" /LENGTH=1261 /DNA_ID=CAMNT_0002379909 /DNA_START=35 /DNA_END=3820 /DNA_ORIENTATION=+